MVESKVPAGRGRRNTRDTEGHDARGAAQDDGGAGGGDARAADDLRFEYAAKLRDEIKVLQRELNEAEASA